MMVFLRPIRRRLFRIKRTSERTDVARTIRSECNTLRRWSQRAARDDHRYRS